MNNYKIRVENEAESCDAIDMLISLGYRKSYNCFDRFGFVWASDDTCGTDRISFFESYDEEKEITINELRDMVVLKRNDRKDSNVSEENCLYDLYLTESEDLYFYHCGKNEWILSNLNGDEDYCKSLKPITKAINCTFDEKPIGSVMKEYLDPRNGYKLIEAPESEALALHASEWIEVPEGANIYAKCNIFGDYKFLPYEVDGDWGVVWQRHTQPEELPFIDGEPTKQDLIDLSNKSLDTVSNTDLSQPMELEYMQGCSVGKTESLNDQYAEIEKFRLKEKMDEFNNTDRGVDFDNFELLEDNVNHPSHYTNGKVECIDALESATVGKRGIEAVCVANVIKYLWRYEDKNGIEDIKKAKWYLEKLINTLE